MLRPRLANYEKMTEGEKIASEILCQVAAKNLSPDEKNQFLDYFGSKTTTDSERDMITKSLTKVIESSIDVKEYNKLDDKDKTSLQEMIIAKLFEESKNYDVRVPLRQPHKGIHVHKYKDEEKSGFSVHFPPGLFYSADELKKTLKETFNNIHTKFSSTKKSALTTNDSKNNLTKYGTFKSYGKGQSKSGAGKSALSVNPSKNNEYRK